MNYVSFFKVFLPSYSSERLLIPLAFVAQVEGRIPDEAFLRNYHGKVWPVKVTKAGNRFHLCDGWPKFVEDNSLDFGEFLVFEYDSTGVFYVQIFEKTECLKEVVGSANLTVSKEEEEEEVEEDEDDNNCEEEEEEDMEHRDDVVMQEVESTSLRRGNKGKAAISDEDIGDIFEHGFVSRPKNPYFVTRLREKRRTELFIPTDVIEDFGLELPKILIVLDEGGKEWPSKVIRWKDGRTWLTKGWKKFCKWNYVKREDRCICEFVRGEGSKGIQLKVCILRKGSWLPKGGKS